MSLEDVGVLRDHCNHRGACDNPVVVDDVAVLVRDFRIAVFKARVGVFPGLLLSIDLGAVHSPSGRLEVLIRGSKQIYLYSNSESSSPIF